MKVCTHDRGGRCSSCGHERTPSADTVIVNIFGDGTPHRGASASNRPKSPNSKYRSAAPQCRRCELEASDSEPSFKGRPRRQLKYANARRVGAMAAAALLAMHLLLCGVLAAREYRARWAPAGVPKIIHQMYATAQLPDKWSNAPAAWAALHPPGEYTYMLWTDEQLRELIATEYPWLLSTYDAYPYATQRWDASRLAVLHKFGGLYADLDLFPVATIDSMLRGQTLLLPHTPNIGLTNAVMASVAGHPFVEYCLHQLPAYAERWYHYSKHNTILTSTGSTYVWAMHMRWARAHPLAESARLMPAPDWGKCSYCERAAAAPAPAPGAGGAPYEGGGAAGAPRRAEEVAAAAPLARPAAKGGEDGAPPPGNNIDDASRGGAAKPAAGVAAPAGGVHGGSWRSPFVHGEGSSWHPRDSSLLMMSFCHVDVLVSALCAVAILLRCRTVRATRRALLSVVAALSVATAHHYNGALILETYIARPWIWLIMS